MNEPNQLGQLISEVMIVIGEVSDFLSVIVSLALKH